MEARKDHYMPPGLLSQIEVLEPPAHAHRVEISMLGPCFLDDLVDAVGLQRKKGA